MKSRLIATPGLFRLSLASVVVLNHSTPIFLGSAAVYLFFILSGFWVYKMWCREYAHMDAPYWNFILSRFWRLMPIYYVALAILVTLNLVLQTHRLDDRGQTFWMQVHYYLAHLFILGSAPLLNKINTQVWSLDIELQFYFIAPVLIGILLRGSRWWLAAICAIAFVGIVMQLIFFELTSTTTFLPMFLAFFLIGLFAAHWQWKPGAVCALGAGAVAAAILAGCTALPGLRPIFFMGSFSGPLSYYNVAANTVIAVLLAPYAVATVSTPFAAQPWHATLDRHLSNITYEVYLLHAAANLVVNKLSGNTSRFDQIPIIVMSWAALGLVCVLVYWYIDRPIDLLRVRFVKSRIRPDPPSPRATESELVGPNRGLLS